MVQRLKATLVAIAPTDGIARGDADLGLAVVGRVDVQEEDILSRARILEDLGSLDDAAGAQIARRGTREQRALVLPLHQVARRVAVDVLKRRALRLVLPDQVVDAVFNDDAGAVGLQMRAIGLFGGCGWLASSQSVAAAVMVMDEGGTST